MGRKLGFTTLFFGSSSSWPWPSCKHPRTHSFRAIDGGYSDEAYKTDDSCFTTSSAGGSASFSTASECSVVEPEEAVMQGLRSDRLFFKPAGGTSSILEEATAEVAPLAGSVAMVMESEDPYRDFRVSMEEMVVANGVRDVGTLEEMLGWYLRSNGKKMHGFIVAAYVDVLVGFGGSLCPSTSFSRSSTSTFEIEEVKEEEANG